MQCISEIFRNKIHLKCVRESQTQRHMPVIPVLGRLGQENHHKFLYSLCYVSEFKASLHCVVRPCLKNQADYVRESATLGQCNERGVLPVVCFLPALAT